MDVQLILPKKHKRELKYLISKARDAKIEWLRGILFISSTLLGILVSFYQKSTVSLYGSLVLVLSILLLVLGILSLSVALYIHVNFYKISAGKYLEELVEAGSEGRKPDTNIALSTKRGIFPFFEKCAYTCLAFAIIGLATNVLLIALDSLTF